MELGEKVLWRRRPLDRKLAKMTCLWEDGILGIKGSSGEYIVGDSKGIWKTRTLRRRPDEEKWDAENLQLVGGVPWRTSDSDAKADGEAWKMDVPPAIPTTTGEVEEDGWKEVVPRRAGLRREDFEKHGYSGGCPGCTALLRGTARQGHSEACRKRMEKELMEDPRWKRARTKIDDFVSKAIVEDEKMRKREGDEDGDQRLEPGDGGA